jgi:hypothetical protein
VAKVPWSTSTVPVRVVIGVAQQTEALNPARNLDRLASLSQRSGRGRRIVRHELYHRVSSSVRVSYSGVERRSRERNGTEEGTAVRLWLTDEDGYRFVAVTGSDPLGVDRALGLALDAPAPSARGLEAATLPLASPLLDHDQERPLPTPCELASRLEEELERFRQTRGPGEPNEPEQAWVEVASTVESWAVDGRPVASRTRQRAWAMLKPACFSGHSPKPALIACRSWEAMPFHRWTQAGNRSDLLDEMPTGSPSEGLSLLFDPETSAALVLALVRGVVCGPGPTGVPAGPGWCVRDLPQAEGALFGGDFDDSARPTGEKILVDGQRLVGRIDGPGHLRRPSFRDLPRPLPSQLHVDPPPGDAVPGTPKVESLSIHPLATGHWVLDIGGGFVTTTPEELLRCCVAGVGPKCASHRGVVTPALRFEGLGVRG